MHTCPFATFRRTLRHCWLPGLLWLLGHAVGCSPLLKFEGDQPCAPAGEGPRRCLEAYSCNQERCVADASLRQGAACSQTVQCAGDSFCPTCLSAEGSQLSCAGAGACAPRCKLEDVFAQGGCAFEHYCKPYLEEIPSAGADSVAYSQELRGGCVRSDACLPIGETSALSPDPSNGRCTPPGSSQEVGKCFRFSASVTACLQPCNISWAEDNTLRAPCSFNQYCQPLFGVIKSNKDASLPLVCLPTNIKTDDIGGQSSVRPKGASCKDPFSEPCTYDAACVAGVCRGYCRLTADAGKSMCDPGFECCQGAHLRKATALDDSLATVANPINDLGICVPLGACSGLTNYPLDP